MSEDPGSIPTQSKIFFTVFKCNIGRVDNNPWNFWVTIFCVIISSHISLIYISRLDFGPKSTCKGFRHSSTEPYNREPKGTPYRTLFIQ